MQQLFLAEWGRSRLKRKYVAGWRGYHYEKGGRPRLTLVNKIDRKWGAAHALFCAISVKWKSQIEFALVFVFSQHFGSPPMTRLRNSRILFQDGIFCFYHVHAMTCINGGYKLSLFFLHTFVVFVADWYLSRSTIGLLTMKAQQNSRKLVILVKNTILRLPAKDASFSSFVRVNKLYNRFNYNTGSWRE